MFIQNNQRPFHTQTETILKASVDSNKRVDSAYYNIAILVLLITQCKNTKLSNDLTYIFNQPIISFINKPAKRLDLSKCSFVLIVTIILTHLLFEHINVMIDCISSFLFIKYAFLIFSGSVIGHGNSTIIICPQQGVFPEMLKLKTVAKLYIFCILSFQIP